MSHIRYLRHENPKTPPGGACSVGPGRRSRSHHCAICEGKVTFSNGSTFWRYESGGGARDKGRQATYQLDAAFARRMPYQKLDSLEHAQAIVDHIWREESRGYRWKTPPLVSLTGNLSGGTSCYETFGHKIRLNRRALHNGTFGVEILLHEIAHGLNGAGLNDGWHGRHYRRILEHLLITYAGLLPANALGAHRFVGIAEEDQLHCEDCLAQDPNEIESVVFAIGRDLLARERMPIAAKVTKPTGRKKPNRISDDQVRELRRLRHEDGWTYKRLAEHFGIHETSCNWIARGLSRKDVV